ncbi:MAG: hypothetical protein WAT22_06835 [Saprospiraceae bacterium]|nr:hypothetical protein [Saprospiraceae bacterium]
MLASSQYKGMLASHQDIKKFPQSTKPDGSPHDRTSEWWCSGFLEVHYGIFMNLQKIPHSNLPQTNGQWQ